MGKNLGTGYKDLHGRRRAKVKSKGKIYLKRAAKSWWFPSRKGVREFRFRQTEFRRLSAAGTWRCPAELKVSWGSPGLQEG